MPLYRYRCPVCGLHDDYDMPSDSPIKAVLDSNSTRCPSFYNLDGRHGPHDLVPVVQCTGRLKRVFSFVIGSSFEPHFNLSANTYVNSKRELDDINKRASAERSERLNLETNFVAHDVRDIKPEDMGVTDEGMGTTHDAQVAAGVKESRGKFTF